ncbi:hypothetical protein JB92DRAFT_3111458 [Gautieria morchelliformis]|nr:hypothetical protein JB92DRAFT_3111458 [Gautieria morchelliformis]
MQVDAAVIPCVLEKDTREMEALEAMFPEDDGIVQYIKPLDRHTYLRYVLSHEVTVELVKKREGCPHSEAKAMVDASWVWGGAIHPLATGTAGEDVNVEYMNMVRSKHQDSFDIQAGATKGKGILPGEQRDHCSFTIKEEEQDLSIGTKASPEGNEIIVID